MCSILDWKEDKVFSILQIIHCVDSPPVYLVNKQHALWLRSDMEDAGALSGRVMPCLLVRLRRRMAPAAVFQSNQNDRVTLERQREDIFLARRSHRDALFPVLLFFYFIYAPALAAWLPGFYRDACLPNRAPETIGPLSWGTEPGNWLLHITCFFKAVSIKGLSLHTGCRRESLTQPLKSGLRGVRGAVSQRAVGWNNVLFF